MLLSLRVVLIFLGASSEKVGKSGGKGWNVRDDEQHGIIEGTALRWSEVVGRTARRQHCDGRKVGGGTVMEEQHGSSTVMEEQHGGSTVMEEQHGGVRGKKLEEQPSKKSTENEDQQEELENVPPQPLTTADTSIRPGKQ